MKLLVKFCAPQKMLGPKKSFGSKIFLSPAKFWVQQNLGSKKILGQQNFNPQKYLGSKKNLGSGKMFGFETNFWSEKILVPKINFDRK